MLTKLQDILVHTTLTFTILTSDPQWSLSPGKVRIFSKVFRLALGPTQPPTQWVGGGGGGSGGCIKGPINQQKLPR
jgi:hypothetical protein